jgi:hypothetical protein
LLRYTISETSYVSIVRVLIILYTQCVLLDYPHKAKLVVHLKPVRFVDEVRRLLCLAFMLMGHSLDLFEYGLPGSAEYEAPIPVEIIGP